MCNPKRSIVMKDDEHVRQNVSPRQGRWYPGGQRGGGSWSPLFLVFAPLQTGFTEIFTYFRATSSNLPGSVVCAVQILVNLLLATLLIN